MLALLVVSADKTEIDLMLMLFSLLKNDNAFFLGTVLNNFKYKNGYGYYQKYYYSYRSNGKDLKKHQGQIRSFKINLSHTCLHVIQCSKINNINELPMKLSRILIIHYVKTCYTILNTYISTPGTLKLKLKRIAVLRQKNKNLRWCVVSNKI